MDLSVVFATIRAELAGCAVTEGASGSPGGIGAGGRPFAVSAFELGAHCIGAVVNDSIRDSRDHGACLQIACPRVLKEPGAAKMRGQDQCSSDHTTLEAMSRGVLARERATE